MRTSAGHVHCGGLNEDGQLGLGHLDPVVGLAHVPGLDDAIDIATVGSAVCAVRRSGQVVCWGHGTHGILGHGGSASTGGRLVPVPGIDGVRRIFETDAAFCVEIGDGTVCFGRHLPPVARGSNEPPFGPRRVDVSQLPQPARTHHPRALAEAVQVVETDGFYVGRMEDRTIRFVARDRRQPLPAALPDVVELVGLGDVLFARTRDGSVFRIAAAKHMWRAPTWRPLELSAVDSVRPLPPPGHGPIPAECEVAIEHLAPVTFPSLVEACGALTRRRDGPCPTDPASARSFLCAKFSRNLVECGRGGVIGVRDIEDQLSLLDERDGVVRYVGHLGLDRIDLEQYTTLRRFDLRRSAPMDVRLRFDVAPSACDFDFDTVCWASLSALRTVHVVERADGTFVVLRVKDARADEVDRPPAERGPAPSMELTGDTVHVSACGGTASFPVPAVHAAAAPAP